MLWTIISFLVIIISIWFYSYRQSKKVNITTSEGFFMGGRSLGAFNVAGAIILTNLSTDQMVGENGQSYQVGMQVMAWEVAATIGIVALALIFLPKYLKFGIDTIPDFLEIRYDATIKRIMSLLFMFTYIASFLPVLLYSGSLVFNQIFHVDQIFHTTQLVAVVALCIIIGLVAIAYLLMGGLSLTAHSDTIYSIGFLLIGILVPVLGLIYLGHGNFIVGVSQVVYHSPVAGMLNSLGPVNSKFVPWPVLFSGMLVNNLYFWCTNQMIVQKALAAKSLQAAQKGTMILGTYKIFAVLFLIIPGVIARNIFGDKFLGIPDNCYPALLVKVLPSALTGVYGAVILGSILSSFSGALNSLVTLFSLDVYKGWLNKKATDTNVAKVGKIATVSAGIICIAIAPFITYAPAGLYQFIQQFNGLYDVPLLVIILFAFWSKKATALSAKIIIPIHIILYCIAIFSFPKVNFLYFTGILFVLEVIAMWFLPKFQHKSDFVMTNYDTKVDITPWKHARLVGILCIVAVVMVYVFFSPLGIGTHPAPSGW